MRPLDPPDIGPPGRDREVAALRSVIATARQGRAAVLVLEGEPGSGKSRLLQHARTLALSAGFRAAQARAFEEDAATPFALVDRLVRDLAAARDSEPSVPLSWQQARRLDVSGDAAAATALASHALDTFFGAGNLVLLVDDLQWGDCQSLRVLQDILRRDHDRAPVLIAALDTTVTSSEALDAILEELVRLPAGRRMTLQRFDHAATRAMIAALLDTPAAAVGSEVSRAVQRASGGLPFVISELVEHLRFEGLLQRSAHAGWELRVAEPLPIPPKVQEVVRRYVQRSSRDEQVVLELAAVWGEDIDAHHLRGAAALLGISEDAASTALRSLAHRGLLRSDEISGPRGEDATRLVLTYPLVQRSLYEQIDPSRRRLLHLTVAQELASAPIVSAAGLAAIARHFAEGHDPARAADYAQRAAEEYERLQQPADELHNRRVTIDALHRAQASVPTGDRAWRLYRSLLRVDQLLEHLERHGEREPVLRDLRALVEDGDDAERRSTVALRVARFALRHGDVPRARQMVALAEATGVTTPEILSDIHVARGEALAGRLLGEPAPLLRATGDLQAARQSYEAALAAAEAVGDERLVGRLLQELGVITGSLRSERAPGSVEQARDYLMRALQQFRTLGDRKGEVTALIALAYQRDTSATREALTLADSYVSFLEEIRRLRSSEHAVGRPEQRSRADALAMLSIQLFCRTNGWYEIALDRGYRALEWAQRARDSRIELLARVAISEAERLIGRGPSALEQAESAWAMLHRDGAGQPVAGHRNAVLAALALAHAEVGIPAQAERFARELMTTTHAVGQPAAIADSASLLAEVLEQGGSHDDAAQAARVALRTAAGLPGNITSDIRAELVLARLALSNGDARIAVGHATAARGRMTQRGVPVIWLQTAVAQVRADALSAAGYVDDAEQELQEAWTLVERIAVRVADPALREAFLTRARIPRDVRDTASRMGKRLDRPLVAPKSASPGPLTRREVEVIRLVAHGASNREIADDLFISEKTVARHLTNIFTKIDVQSRTQAAAWAFRNGIV
jgi:DNA-binding CsgD family transcriptional regulator/tetratricopeptide (TPR) repeat protein